MPTTIGPFSNVPAAGDPTTSAWARQLTQYAVDNAGLPAHVADTVDAHDASAISTNGFDALFPADSDVMSVLIGMQGVTHSVATPADLPADSGAANCYSRIWATYWGPGGVGGPCLFYGRGDKWYQIYGPGVTPGVTPWADLPTVGTWTPSISPFGWCMYRVISGVVYLKGGLGNPSSTVSTQQNIALLPAGARPQGNRTLSATSADAFMSLRVNPAGEILLQAPSQYLAWISLNGCSFVISETSAELLPADDDEAAADVV